MLTILDTSRPRCKPGARNVISSTSKLSTAKMSKIKLLTSKCRHHYFQHQTNKNVRYHPTLHPNPYKEVMSFILTTFWRSAIRKSTSKRIRGVFEKRCKLGVYVSCQKLQICIGWTSFCNLLEQIFWRELAN
jgi:hypothetical protein